MLWAFWKPQLHRFNNYKCVVQFSKHICDFHLMTLAAMREEYWKFQSRLISYRSYSHFLKILWYTVENIKKQAPCKQNSVWSNQTPSFTEELSKAIMKGSRHRDVYLKNRNDTNRLLHTKQRNYCVFFLMKTRKGYYDNLNEKCVTDNKHFWKTLKPFLSDKFMTRDKIYLTKTIKL